MNFLKDTGKCLTNNFLCLPKFNLKRLSNPQSNCKKYYDFEIVTIKCSGKVRWFRLETMWLVRKISVFTIALLILAGCQSGNIANLSTFGESPESVDDVSDVAFYKDDELLARAKLQFQEKNFGKAYAIYKRAAEVFPKDPVAWLGYSASADMIGRFDNADRGYSVLAKMIPNRAEYLNNVGYSYLLRGNLVTARRYFLKAYDIDPANVTTANNLELLRNSVSFAKRG